MPDEDLRFLDIDSTWAQARMNQSDSSILIIDDERHIVDLATAFLSAGGFTVFGMTDPEDAIQLVKRNHSIKLILSDISMPGVTGPELVRRALKSREDEVRVLFMSGGFEGVRFRHTDPLLEKPFSFQSLVREIQAALAKPPQLSPWSGLERRRQAA